MSLKQLPVIAKIVLAVMVVLFLPRPGEPDMLRRLVTGAILLLVAALVVNRVARTQFERLILLAVAVLAAASIWSSMGLADALFVWPFIGLAAVILIYQQWYPVLQYLFFGRFPLLIAAALVSLPVIGIWALPLLFRTMFILDWGALWFVTLLTVVAGAVAVYSAGIIARNAEARFKVEAWTWLADTIKARRWWLTAIVAGPVVGSTFWFREASLLAASIAVPSAIVLAILIVKLGEGVGELLTSGSDLSSSPVNGGSGKGALAGLERKARSATEPYAGKLRRAYARKAQSAWFGDGYVTSTGELVPGHLAAIGFFLTTLAIYLVAYFLLKPNGLLKAPSLAFVIFILIMLGWVLPAISFFLDRFRVSTVLALAAMPFVLSFINNIDHYYEYYQLPAAIAARAPTAADSAQQPETELRTAFAARLARAQALYPEGEPVIIAVAAGGGGGTAALWSARVLEGLHEEFKERFTDSIHLISAVSGGSVGAMFFMSAFDPPAGPDDRGKAPSLDRLKATVETAGTSSLAAAAWGLSYPDFWRLFSLRHPFNDYIDRGWALEEAWDGMLGRDRGRRLSDWREGILKGWRPAILFNATVSETGERLIISPLQLADRHCKDADPADAVCGDQGDARTLRGLYPGGADLRIATAARLSASFPFVSPIPKPRVGENAVHVADGGYYDNGGMVSAVEWAHKAFEFAGPVGARKMKMLVIDIRVVEPDQKPKERAGWVYATIGPIVTLFTVRGSSQVSRNDVELKLLTDLLKKDDFEIQRAEFPLTLKTSLSWHLPQSEKNEIEKYWKDNPVAMKSRMEIHDFLRAANWPGM